MYCLHHEDEELVGSDPVPCPFCGYGADQAPVGSDEIEALGIEDSTTALQHALTSDESSEIADGLASARQLRGYW